MNSILPPNLSMNNLNASDHARVMGVLKGWWGGRDLTCMLPRLFLIHFSDTSFKIEKDNELVAFLIGFLSPSVPNEGYIHFAGVHPGFRKLGLGKSLYDHFFSVCRENNRDTVRACTSPVNLGSIEFHKKMGFAILPGNGEIDGIQVTLDYNRPLDHKVLFKKDLLARNIGR